MGFLDSLWHKAAQQAGNAGHAIHTVLGDVSSDTSNLASYAYNNTLEPLGDAFTAHRNAQYQHGLVAPPGTVTSDYRLAALRTVLEGLPGGHGDQAPLAAYLSERARQQYLHPQPEGKRIGMSGIPGHDQISFWEA